MEKTLIGEKDEKFIISSKYQRKKFTNFFNFHHYAYDIISTVNEDCLQSSPNLIKITQSSHGESSSFCRVSIKTNVSPL